MKEQLRVLFFFLFFALLAMTASAQRGNGMGGGGGGKRGGVADGSGPRHLENLEALDHFLTLSDAELDRLAAAIDRVRAMSPEERAQFRARIARYQQLPADQREQIRAGWVSERDWADWRLMMEETAPERRNEIHQKLRAMPFEERAAFKNGLLEQWRKTGRPPRD